MIRKLLQALVLASLFSLGAMPAGALTLSIEGDPSSSTGDPLRFVVPFEGSARFYVVADPLGTLIDPPELPAGNELFYGITFLFQSTGYIPGDGTDRGFPFLISSVPVDVAALPPFPFPETAIENDTCGLTSATCEFGYSAAFVGPYSPPSLSGPTRIAAFDVVHIPGAGRIGDEAGFQVNITGYSVVALDSDGNLLFPEVIGGPVDAGTGLVVTAIPEPSSVWLFAIGLLALAGFSTGRRTRPTAPAVS